MTSKEKAEELQESFKNLSRDGNFTSLHCSKFMVDEIIKLLDFPDTRREEMEFWKEVKKCLK